MTYPTLEQVRNADHYRICEWWRFLPTSVTDEQTEVIDAIALRYSQGGGLTAEISNAIDDRGDQ